MTDPSTIVSRLSDAQREALLDIERSGNGKYPFCLHPFAKLGIMALTPVPELMDMKAYRLTPLGLAVRALISED